VTVKPYLPPEFGPAGVPPDAKPVDVMMAYLGVRETGGPNRGPWIDECLRFVGLDPAGPDAPHGGYAWCCAALVWCAHKGGVDLPRTALVAHLWRGVADRRIDTIEPGCGFVHLLPGGVHGHTGFVLRDNRDGDVMTLSGNTNGSGSRNGDRVGIVMHPKSYILDNGGGFFHMRPELPEGVG
jgi:hypothetical protein